MIAIEKVVIARKIDLLIDEKASIVRISKELEEYGINAGEDDDFQIFIPRGLSIIANALGITVEREDDENGAFSVKDFINYRGIKIYTSVMDCRRAE